MESVCSDIPDESGWTDENGENNQYCLKTNTCRCIDDALSLLKMEKGRQKKKESPDLLLSGDASWHSLYAHEWTRFAQLRQNSVPMYERFSFLRFLLLSYRSDANEVNLLLSNRFAFEMWSIKFPLSPQASLGQGNCAPATRRCESFDLWLGCMALSPLTNVDSFRFDSTPSGIKASYDARSNPPSEQ